MGPIALITDFGHADHYVAAMKGILLGRAPAARIIDVTHRIPPGNIHAAAFILRQVFDVFPPGTLHLAVVDPGVGSGRRILAGRYAGRTLLVPDNGLLTLVHRDRSPGALRSVENTDLFAARVSPTFHGRDIFAPVAGALAAGLALREVGPSIDDPRLLPIDRPRRLGDGGLEGRIVYVDHFGNLISNIPAAELEDAGRWEIFVGTRSVGPLRTTYADVSPGEALALIGSCGTLEVAVNGGDAAARLDAAAGSAILARLVG